MSTRLLFADSKNRDYPSGNSYVLHLTRPIKNIERVDLVSARVPNTMWNCTQGSNVFSTDTSNVSINPGFYSAYTLAQDVTVPVVPVNLYSSIGLNFPIVWCAFWQTPNQNVIDPKANKLLLVHARNETRYSTDPVLVFIHVWSDNTRVFFDNFKNLIQ